MSPTPQLVKVRVVCLDGGRFKLGNRRRRSELGQKRSWRALPLSLCDVYMYEIKLRSNAPKIWLNFFGLFGMDLWCSTGCQRGGTFGAACRRSWQTTCSTYHSERGGKRQHATVHGKAKEKRVKSLTEEHRIVQKEKVGYRFDRTLHLCWFITCYFLSYSLVLGKAMWCDPKISNLGG